MFSIGMYFNFIRRTLMESGNCGSYEDENDAGLVSSTLYKSKWGDFYQRVV